MKKFYHVSLNLREGIDKVFTPYVPDRRMEGEEDKTPRICICDTLEGCLTAAPFGGSNLEEILTDSGRSCPIKVFVFYEEDIEDGNLICPDHLYKEDLVRDALFSGEH